MALVSRDLSISWGGYVISTANNRLINGWTYSDDGYETASVEFEFVVIGSSDSTFAAECAAAEAAFRKPRETLTIMQGTTPILSLSHSGNTGFDSDPMIIKQGQVGDTGRSRFYRVHITFGRPADNVGTAGRRYGTIDVAYTPSRQAFVTISGTYTALGVTGSRGSYQSAIATYCTGVLGSLGITEYELLEEPQTESNDTDKVINFRRVYRQILYPQTDASSVVGDTLEIEIDYDGAEDGDESNHLVIVNATYDASVDKDVTTNLEGLWSSIKGSVYGKIRGSLGLKNIGIVHETPSFDYTSNRISASLHCAGVYFGNIISKKETTRTVVETGAVLTPAWTGESLSYYLFQGPKKILTYVTTSTRALGGGSSGRTAGSAGGGAGTVQMGIVPAGGSWLNVFGLTGFMIFNESEPPRPAGPTSIVAQGGTSDAGAGGAGGGAGARNQQQAASGAAAASAGKPREVPVFFDEERTPMRIGLPNGDCINFTDTTTIKVTQSILELAQHGPMDPTSESQDSRPEIPTPAGTNNPAWRQGRR